MSNSNSNKVLSLSAIGLAIASIAVAAYSLNANQQLEARLQLAEQNSMNNAASLTELASRGSSSTADEANDQLGAEAIQLGEAEEEEITPALDEIGRTEAQRLSQINANKEAAETYTNAVSEQQRALSDALTATGQCEKTPTNPVELSQQHVILDDVAALETNVNSSISQYGEYSSCIDAAMSALDANQESYDADFLSLQKISQLSHDNQEVMIERYNYLLSNAEYTELAVREETQTTPK